MLFDLLLQFLIIFIYIYIGHPGIQSQKLLSNKLLLFISTIIFKIIYDSIVSIKNKCTNKISSILDNSLLMGISTIIGYSIFIDINLLSNNNQYFNDALNSKLLTSLIISGIIALTVLVFRIIRIIYGKGNKCKKHNDNKFYNFI